MMKDLKSWLAPSIGIVQTILLITLIVYIFNLDREFKKISRKLVGISTQAPSVAGKVNIKADAQAPVMGKENAKVDMIVFSDFQCGYCKTFAMETLPRLKNDYVEKGLLRISFRNLPLAMHDKAIPAAEAGACANEQGKFWELHDVFFKNQDSLTNDFFIQTAKNTGADMAKFNACLRSNQYKTAIEKTIEEANAAGITGTPAIIINGNVVLGARPYEYFKNIIENELGSDSK